MSIVNLLIRMSNNILDNDSIDEIIKMETFDIRHAIKSNNSEKIKLYMSDRLIYANEIKVTSY